MARLRWWGFAFGLLGIAAMGLHFSGIGLGLGVGGMECVTAYGIPIWLGLAGLRLFLTEPVRTPVAPGSHRSVVVRR
ncbi:hypothetical protein OG474_24805 [Kribbella sp. NBC_01505]|uniref:hypothetical protein n=1 Tax=Kribbella sp. NBC_01505 TaxID=2903580 RepID=UPI00386C9824